MRVCEFGVASDVRGRDYFARRRLGADYFSSALKAFNDFYTELYDHCRFTSHRVMVKEAIMTVCPQAFMAT